MRCIEGKGGLKDIHCSSQNAALFVDQLKNLFFYHVVKIYVLNTR